MKTWLINLLEKWLEALTGQDWEPVAIEPPPPPGPKYPHKRFDANPDKVSQQTKFFRGKLNTDNERTELVEAGKELRINDGEVVKVFGKFTYVKEKYEWILYADGDEVLNDIILERHLDFEADKNGIMYIEHPRGYGRGFVHSEDGVWIDV